MVMKTKIVLIIIFNLLLTNINLALTPAALGDHWYNRRAEGSVGIYADKTPINNAIIYYQKAYNFYPNEVNTVALLKCYYFKGSFVKSTQEERKVIFNAGKDLGEKMSIQYPNSAPIKYWLAAHWGKWAKNFGAIQAVYKGAAQKILTYSKAVVRLDPDYNDAGGFNVLGLLHLYAPHIPFVLTWPSHDFALQNLKKAVELAPTIGNYYCLAQAYVKKGYSDQAETLLKKILTVKPRKNKIVEDKNGLAKAEEALVELISKK